MRKSNELNTSLLMVVSFAMMSFLWDYIGERCASVFTTFLSPEYLGVAQFHLPDVTRTIAQAGARLLLIIMPLLLVTVVSGVLVNIIQVGLLFTTKPLAPKFSRVNPMAGFKRIFSIRSVVELVKSLAKVAIIVLLCYGDIERFLGNLPISMMSYPAETIDFTMRTAFSMGLKVAMFTLAVGVGDFAFQSWKYEKDMRMSKQEVKDEYKTMEGDPKIKGKIRQKQRQMAAMRMMQSVPDADVVITNPTHYAIALAYDESVSSAPMVLAKGKDLIASKIKDIARAHGIETVENRPLAQALYAVCEVGDPIPATLYQTVAEVLAMVYNLKRPQKRTKGGAGA